MKLFCIIMLLLSISLNTISQVACKASYPENELDFTQLDIKLDSIMEQYKIPGMQLAIMQDDRIIYKQSYGFSNKELQQKVTDTSLFRIASISKPITAIAILKLAEEGILDLDQTVFGEKNTVLGTDFGKSPYTDKVCRITIRHLLEHKSGWINEPDDPMFRNPQITLHQLIEDILTSREPAYEPGEKYNYLNFGYCLLGRIVEKVTGMSYESYVLKYIAAPCGISRMTMAGNTWHERKPDEVKYYSQETTDPYIMNVHRMDAHGGWLASAEDLLKFMTHIDRNPGKVDLLSEKQLQTLYFGYFKWIHTGSLPGTTAILTRYDDHFSYCILANTRQNQPDSIAIALQSTVEKLLQE